MNLIIKRLVIITLTSIFSWLFVSCNGAPPCCPKLTENDITVDSWVCPAHCPGGGKTTVFAKVLFWQKDELCEPPENFRIYVYNVTKGEELPPLKIDTVKVGHYQFKQELTLETDTEFEVRAVGDKECGQASVKFPVRVVNPGNDIHNIRFSEKKDWPDNKWSLTLKTTPGVLLHKIVSINDINITVHHLGLHLGIAKRDTWTADPGQKIRADGIWEIEIPNKTEYDEYNNLGQPPVGIDIVLRCDCP